MRFLYCEHVWTCSALNRLLGNKDQAEVRPGISGAEHPGVLERVPDRSNVGGHPQPGGQADPATDAVGLVPWWAKDIKVGFSSINARAETVDTSRAFRDAWKKGQRCLVVTDGFYEWKKPEKQPYAIAMADKRHMVMAGLWDEWTDKKTGERVKSCTIITCPANAVVGTLHDRMPVILAEEDWAKWLGEEPATNDELKALLVPFKDEALTMWPVNRQKVGNVRNKDRDAAEPEPLDALTGS
jgi:putative SOS response-associated peptidase YedK